MLNNGGNFSPTPAFKSKGMKGNWRAVLLGTASLLVVILAFGGSWSLAYHRGFDHGYAQGGRDEFLRWKQEPTRVGQDWDGMITGHRNMREKATVWAGRSGPWPINAWSAPFSATGAVTVSASGEPIK